MKEELRSMRLEAHTKQLTKELKSARTALEQERKLRKVQSDTIKVCMMMNQFSYGRLSPFNAINTVHLIILRFSGKRFKLCK